MLDARVAAAAEFSIGLETELTWDKAIKATTLCLLQALGTLIAGYSLGEVASELITWIDKYDDDTDKEGTADGASDKDPAGTSASWDIGLHSGTTVLGWMVFVAIAIGGDIFQNIFLNFNDGVVCDFDGAKKSDYAGINAILE